jgi:hypothetical protein
MRQQLTTDPVEVKPVDIEDPIGWVYGIVGT